MTSGSKSYVSNNSTFASSSFKLTPVTNTLIVPFLLFEDVAITSIFPDAIALITPLFVTSTLLLLSLIHVIVLSSVVLVGKTYAEAL